MNTEPVKKNEIVCAFHRDVEYTVCNLKKRVDVLIYITIVNALLTGAHIALKLPSIF